MHFLLAYELKSLDDLVVKQTLLIGNPYLLRGEETN